MFLLVMAYTLVLVAPDLKVVVGFLLCLEVLVLLSMLLDRPNKFIRGLAVTVSTVLAALLILILSRSFHMRVGQRLFFFLS